MLTMAVEREWEIWLADVITAFLHAPVLETTYVEPPTCLNLPHDVCWELKKALYGLKSAPRSWNQHLTGVVTAGGWRQSTVEQGAYYHMTDEVVDGVMIVRGLHHGLGNKTGPQKVAWVFKRKYKNA